MVDATVEVSEPIAPFERIPFAIGETATVQVARLTAAALVSRMVAAIDAGRGMTISYLNFHTVNVLESKPELAGLFEQFDVVTPEGGAMIWALQRLGHEVGRENILSAEFLIPLMFEAAITRKWGVYLLGGAPGVAEGAARNLEGAFPGIRIAGTRHGMFTSPEQERDVVGEIRRLESRILLVGMGQPRQEAWVADHRARLGPLVVLALGGYFDKVAKAAEAYPAWVYRWNVFWAYRLATEPRALWKRYLVGGPRFVWRALRMRAPQRQ